MSTYTPFIKLVSRLKRTMQSRDAWLKAQATGNAECDPIASEFRAKIPANFIAINSECNISSVEEDCWDALAAIYKVHVSTFDDKGEHVKKIGVGVFACGEMCWTVFIDPVALAPILAKHLTAKGRKEVR